LDLLFFQPFDAGEVDICLLFPAMNEMKAYVHMERGVHCDDEMSTLVAGCIWLGAKLNLFWTHSGPSFDLEILSAYGFITFLIQK